VVITGMLAATCIAIFIIPMLFVVVEKIAAWMRGTPPVSETAAPHSAGAGADD
jgi:hypothetical protein